MDSSSVTVMREPCHSECIMSGFNLHYIPSILKLVPHQMYLLRQYAMSHDQFVRIHRNLATHIISAI